MQTSYATISQLALAFLAAQAVAAPVAAVAGSGTELDARSPVPVKMCGRFQDQGFGCVRQCYGSNCADVPRSKPAKRDVEGRDGEVEKRTPVPVQMCGNMPDQGFGCVTQCYGSTNCRTTARSKPAKRDAEGDDGEVEKRAPVPAKMCGGFPDLGFGCVTQCYGSRCGESPRSKPAKREEDAGAQAAQTSEDEAGANEE
ncbi:hypothetical protein MCOR03_011470 [Pyricularia oryzae]|nr:hypothetical protein MCOR03_011470 [Pyricularia oryzae]